MLEANQPPYCLMLHPLGPHPIGFSHDCHRTAIDSVIPRRQDGYVEGHHRDMHGSLLQAMAVVLDSGNAALRR